MFSLSLSLSTRLTDAPTPFTSITATTAPIGVSSFVAITLASKAVVSLFPQLLSDAPLPPHHRRQHHSLRCRRRVTALAYLPATYVPFPGAIKYRVTAATLVASTVTTTPVAASIGLRCRRQRPICSPLPLSPLLHLPYPPLLSPLLPHLPPLLLDNISAGATTTATTAAATAICCVLWKSQSLTN